MRHIYVTAKILKNVTQNPVTTYTPRHLFGEIRAVGWVEIFWDDLLRDPRDISVECSPIFFLFRPFLCLNQLDCYCNVVTLSKKGTMWRTSTAVKKYIREANWKIHSEISKVRELFQMILVIFPLKYVQNDKQDYIIMQVFLFPYRAHTLMLQSPMRICEQSRRPSEVWLLLGRTNNNNNTYSLLLLFVRFQLIRKKGNF